MLEKSNQKSNFKRTNFNGFQFGKNFNENNSHFTQPSWRYSFDETDWDGAYIFGFRKKKTNVSFFSFSKFKSDNIMSDAIGSVMAFKTSIGVIDRCLITINGKWITSEQLLFRIRMQLPLVVHPTIIHCNIIMDKIYSVECRRSYTYVQINEIV